ncbi:17-beta-hydroxysteroid dehydrogenase type 6-like [Mercenaria mercenaria]|uniref:17-beta-hydroxysteroid dehydrogenase type 6-like n=1 Tax=Mercenaria mercenaria TaxID=6596 RepID=UPI00234F2FCA|nr:17-beta-hydroxysteroid dehydrogenase type 6-like [Mercenaria mercenaria]
MYWLLVLVIFLLILTITWHTLHKLKIGNISSRYVLVTGCDSGFGNLLTKQLDLLGFHVFAGCLTQAGVESVKSECSDKVLAIQMDVSNDESIKQTIEVIRKKIPSEKALWAVVNNAGIIGSIGPSTWQTRQNYNNTMAVNLYGVIMVTKACMPLVLKEHGRIINTASIMGRFAFVDPSYCVSKYGVEAFSDVLRREIYRSGVSVHIIEPGFYRTPLMDRESYRQKLNNKIKQLPEDVKESLPCNFADMMMRGRDTFLEKVASSKVNEVVEAYIDAIISQFPKSRYLVGFDAKFIFRPLSMLPEWISDRVIIKMLP